ncbi:23S rRNA (pseudouridine(1915)-N(3))-methyltransferase RlmH [Novacetimonas pomaceti]|uniref:Ribosomal RNA large subunit methyltransferase H n=2 Tax=Novacetimonas pomaceti TaxID=2021998 RepID=A0A318QFG8_9PROT|nr:23S rRNA (pseudouridine(1915)-N(3))-methyltransferase RlmH [Novacetimonas pomaceti]
MLHMIAIGRMKDRVEKDLFSRYAERLSPRLRLTELPEGRGATAEIKRREGQALLAALPARAHVVAMDEGGRPHDSLSFARALERWMGLSRPICFLIGGAEGLDSCVMERADDTLSLGPMTWPHMLVRGLLAEQLYRARAIATGHPYHRAGRPD